MVLKISNPVILEAVSNCIISGGVAILSGDTVYGFTGLVPLVEGKIRNIKGRGDMKPFLHLIGDLEWIRMYTDYKVPAELLDLWPGPLTLIIPVIGNGKIVSGNTTAIRFPDNEFLLKLLRAVKNPLISTSVNRSGEPPETNIGEIIKRYEDEVDLIVDSGNCETTQPSTLLDIAESPFRIIRQGACRIPASLLD
jgi:L-threonylcarbamoyladenylate synthase